MKQTIIYYNSERKQILELLILQMKAREMYLSDCLFDIRSIILRRYPTIAVMILINVLRFSCDLVLTLRETTTCILSRLQNIHR